ncbi:MAG TPA: glycosyltransferase family 2 protein [Thermoflexales bacterium]|nr:glycosyltransferase family 2 protein [Anaerolineae bacterium]HQX12015.1 glycosyltransferase family 2 protein [Thermoflexales bacterium]
MYHNKTVSVIFPAYNEENYIRAAVEDFFSNGVVDEIVVVNNNSRDRTEEEARKTAARVVLETKQGYGNALQRGLREASGEIIILAEPDSTFMGKDVLKLLAYSDDFDMVCGTRTTAELIWREANMGWFLRLGNWIVAKFTQFLYNTCSLSDMGCTMRLIHRKALLKFVNDLSVGGSHFLPEMIVLAKRENLKVIEIPVNYRGRVGESKITGNLKGTLRTGFRMIALVIRYKLAPRART